MIRASWLLASAAALTASPVLAAQGAPSSADSFRIGSTGVLCTAQRRSEDDRYVSMFDRGYDVVCRDAALPVGRLYVLKGKTAAPPTGKTCKAAESVALEGLAGVSKTECVDPATGLNHTHYAFARGGNVYAVEGLSAYDSALRLGFASIVSDRQTAGEVSVATTNAGDPAAFARVQAASLDPEQALAQGYGRNIEGSYAEASEFFEALVARSRTAETGNWRSAEYLANQAIQQSNLGNAAEADRLFAEAAKASDAADPLFARLFRNLKVMHALNGRDAGSALELLESPMPVLSEAAGTRERLAEGFIDRKMSQRLAVDGDALTRLGGGSGRLTELERAALLEAQARYLRGVALRLRGKPQEARAELTAATSDFAAVRGGAVASMRWMLASAATELALIADANGDVGATKAHLRDALAVYEATYPESATALSARARLAGIQAKSGERAASVETFRALVRDAARIPGGSDALRALIKPYFDTLVGEGGAASAGDFFTASQVMVRPGVAQTQAVLARELSGGSDEASSLFRQSVVLTREIVSIDVEIARLTAIEERTAAQAATLTTAQAHRAQRSAEQTGLQAKLAAFPKFRVMGNAALDLAVLQQQLGADEAYYKLLLVGETAYGLMVRRDSARAVKLETSRAELEAMTDKIRDSIVLEMANQLVTNPFDLRTARAMYVKLFGAFEVDISAAKHLIFEPDGPLLKLPVNILVAKQDGIDAYEARIKASNPDLFDFTGVSWLGRDRKVSTAVSAQSFVDVRRIAPAKGSRRYLGVGQNTPVDKLAYAPKTEEGRDPCDWNLGLWDKPISAEELRLASSLLGGNGNEVIVEADYSDTALRDRKDLTDFRIVQFATHGLVTAPKPGCPARPALVTSFGPRDSDGLLSFKEIFDLRLDADTVILSACDTAGAATLAATREAGITTGGNFALDGLVRAFVGAGARTVIASHWPVPDDYDATRKLMSVIYEGGTVLPVGEAMRQSQVKLMDDPLTSHPYYWAAFAIVGDAAKPLTTADEPTRMASNGTPAATSGGTDR